MTIKYVCKNNPEHIFNEPTADFWCSLCPIEKRSMLHRVEEQDESETTQLEEDKTDVVREEIEEPNKIESNQQEDRGTNGLSFVQIGNQLWSNRSLVLDDLVEIEDLWLATTSAEWIESQAAKRPAFCYPNQNIDIANEQGFLFNWFALKSIQSKLPKTWRIPTVKDVEILKSSVFKDKEKFFKSDYAFRQNIHIEHRLPMSTYADASVNRCYWTSDEAVFYTAYAFQIQPESEVLEVRKIDKNAGYFLRIVKD
jgi:uncharacterized protein (TIGR02145 family)